jgi:hypothetical protein
MVALAGCESGSPRVAVELRHVGGALARVAPGAGARGHIDAPYIYFAVGVPATPELAAAIPARLAQIKGALSPWIASGAYLNFAEKPTDLSAAFEPETFHTLRAVKAKYDPRDTIHANHAIAPAAE